MTKKPSDGNGWRAGQDPIQRWLRIIASVVCLIVFAWLALDPSRRDWPTLTIALGALLVLLGYEAIVRLPYLGRSDNPFTPPSPPPDYYQQQQQYPYQPPNEERPDNIIVSGDDHTPEV